MADIAKILDSARVGLADDMPWREYLRTVGMNGSTLVEGIEKTGGSMKALKWTWDHDKKDTDDMQWGRALHTLVLEPREFEGRYDYWEGKRQGNKYQEFKADCWEQGKEVLREVAWNSVQTAALEFIKHPLIQPVIASGKAEIGVLAVEYEMQCKGRLDFLANPFSIHYEDCFGLEIHEEYPDGALVDIKTSRAVDEWGFSKAFRDFNYATKLGLYQRWLEAATGVKLPVLVLALKNNPPYDAGFYPIADSILEMGVRRGLKVLRDVRMCIEADYWPGVCDKGPQGIILRPWDMDDDDDNRMVES